METTQVKEFSKRLDKIFEDGQPTKAMIIDAFIKNNPTALMPVNVDLADVSGSLSSLQEWAKKKKDNQIEEVIVRTAFGNTIVVDLTSKSSIDEFCDFK